MDDESFFALIRNYLGPVRTPYNKHELIGAMVEFLSRDETRQRIVEHTDHEDRLLLAAVELLGHPSEEILYRFLEDQFDYGRFRWLVANHRDRLLLIDGTTPEAVRINPLLRTPLLVERLHPEQLLAGIPLEGNASEQPGELPWFSRIFVATFYAFLREEPELFTRNGALRKRILSSLRDRFGSLFQDQTGQTQLRTALLALKTLELIDQDDKTETIRLRHDAWDELSELPDNWIQALLWATLLTGTLERAFDIAPVLIEFARRVPRDRSFSDVEIVRILRLTGTGMHLPFDRESPARLAETGFLLPTGDRFRINTTAARSLETAQGSSTGAALHSNMEITITPDLSFRALLDLAAIARLRRFDVMPVLELTERSLTSARRIDRDQAPETLRRITGTELPQNVSFLLKQWQTRAGAVRLIQGLILRVEGEAAELVESSAAFGAYVQERLAPGIFLLRPDSRKDVDTLLNELGIGSPGGLEQPPMADARTPEYRRFYQRHQQPVLAAHPSISFDKIPPGTGRESGAESGSGAAVESPPPERPEQPKQPEEHRRLQDLLAALKEQDLAEEVYQELALRIERKLILFPEQIRSDLVPTYGVEARGLDYIGKIRIAEQAIRDKELLEVIMRDTDGSPRRMLVHPREIKESGGDLMLRALQLPEEAPVRIRIRRASLVRRLSGTLLRRRR